MKTAKKQLAFTLIEVLIALVILAIALSAILIVTENNVRNTTYVSERIRAHWVAMNVIARIQAGLLRTPIAGESIQGTSSMLNQAWRWQAYREGKASNEFMRMGVDMYSADKVKVSHLDGFVASQPSGEIK